MNKPETVDIIIPTFDNYNQLNDCLQSMSMSRIYHPMRVIVVNNGTSKLEELSGQHKDFSIEIVAASENLGWIGGLREGLKHSTSKYVMFANDDIFVPRSSIRWLSEMVRTLDTMPSVGAVGPSSNVVMGVQNIWNNMPSAMYDTTFLIGFCILVRREALDKAGGIQDMEFGGDDLDLSIRLRESGYVLIAKRDVFIYHHGFQTGNRIHGDHTTHNGWNSRNMTDNVNMELIRKHGFLSWWEMMVNRNVSNEIEDDDIEREIVKGFLNGDKNVVEVGCGSRKTVDFAIGVDVTPNGEPNPFIAGVSVADVVANVEKEMPFDNKSIDCIIARHVLEHMVDPVSVLRLWKSKLRDGGRLIVSCPDERLFDSIPMNPEHKHVFTPDSLVSLSKLVGFKGKNVAEGYNGVSFTVHLETA